MITIAISLVWVHALDIALARANETEHWGIVPADSACTRPAPTDDEALTRVSGAVVHDSDRSEKDHPKAIEAGLPLSPEEEETITGQTGFVAAFFACLNRDPWLGAFPFVSDSVLLMASSTTPVHLSVENRRKAIENGYYPGPGVQPAEASFEVRQTFGSRRLEAGFGVFVEFGLHEPASGHDLDDSSIVYWKLSSEMDSLIIIDWQRLR